MKPSQIIWATPHIMSTILENLSAEKKTLAAVVRANQLGLLFAGPVLYDDLEWLPAARGCNVGTLGQYCEDKSIPSARQALYASGVKSLRLPRVSSLQAQVNITYLLNIHPKLEDIWIRIKGYPLHDWDYTWTDNDATGSVLLTLSGDKTAVEVSIEIQDPDSHGNLDILDMLDMKVDTLYMATYPTSKNWLDYRRRGHTCPDNQRLNLQLHSVVFGDCNIEARRRDSQEVGDVTIESALLKPVALSKVVLPYLTCLEGGNHPVAFETLVAALEYMPDLETLEILVEGSTSKSGFLHLAHLLPKVVSLKVWDDRHHGDLTGNACDLLELLEMLFDCCPRLEILDVPFSIAATALKIAKKDIQYRSYRRRPDRGVVPRFPKLIDISLSTNPNDVYKMTVLSFVYLILHLFDNQVDFSITNALEVEEEDYGEDIDYSESLWDVMSRNNQRRNWKVEVERTLKVVKEEIFDYEDDSEDEEEGSWVLDENGIWSWNRNDDNESKGEDNVKAV